MVIKNAKTFDDENQGFEPFGCGYVIHGNKKKIDLLKRLHYKKCKICTIINKLSKEGKLQILEPDVSQSREVEKLMNKGMSYQQAHSKVTNMKIDSIRTLGQLL